MSLNTSNKFYKNYMVVIYFDIWTQENLPYKSSILLMEKLFLITTNNNNKKLDSQ